MTIEVIIDGISYAAGEDENLAALMIRNALIPFRKNPADGSPRAAFCMMGICYECMVNVDNMRSTQACLVSVKDGMIVRRNIHD